MISLIVMIAKNVIVVRISSQNRFIAMGSTHNKTLIYLNYLLRRQGSNFILNWTGKCWIEHVKFLINCWIMLEYEYNKKKKYEGSTLELWDHSI